VTTAAAPITERVQTLDGLRGVAVLGILLANVLVARRGRANSI